MEGPYNPEFRMCAPTRVVAEAIGNSLVSIKEIISLK